MSTAAIIPDFNGFERDGAPFPSESTFDNILSQFEQDPVFLDPLYQAPGYYLRPISPVPKIPLTHLPPYPSLSEQVKKGNRASLITNTCVGDDDFPAQSGEGMQSKHSIEHVDSSWADMSQPKVLIAGLLDRRNSTLSNEESLVGLERSPTQIKMRSASHRPKKYRTRLKQKFERLLAVLQASKTKDESGGEGDSEAPDCGYSRGEVLDFARQRILALEEENRHLSDQVEHLDRGVTIV